MYSEIRDKIVAQRNLIELKDKEIQNLKKFLKNSAEENNKLKLKLVKVNFERVNYDNKIEQLKREIELNKLEVELLKNENKALNQKNNELNKYSKFELLEI